jgi:uncharacterized membrane protein YraQ (UPF0718 family)
MLIDAAKYFFELFKSLFVLFIGISFFVALVQVYLSKETIKKLLTTPHKLLNSILGAALGAVTPFCSCTTVPILVGLFKSKAPFSGAMSFLLTSPVLNPAIFTLFITFFGLKTTIVYAGFILIFSVVMGLILDKLGFDKEVKNVKIQGGNGEEITYASLTGTFWQKNLKAWIHALKESVTLFRKVLLFLIIGAGIGAFIHGFVPEELLAGFAGASSWWAVPVSAIAGIPMYIRAETMIPIAGVLIDKGVGLGTVIALIIGGAGISIPEMTILGSIFKKKMMITLALCIFSVATIAGFLFNILM